MARKGENIYRRKDNRWEGRYKKYCQLTGKCKTGYVYGRTYREVKEKLQVAKSPYEIYDSPDGALLFSKISNDWLDKERLMVKSSTYAKYCSILRNHILPFFQDYQLSQINANVINHFILLKLQGGENDSDSGLSPKTVRDILTVLKSILKMAADEYDYPLKLANIALPKIQDTSASVLDDHQRKRLESYILDDSIDLRNTGLLICLYTGLRLGEICGLKWSDINLESGVLSVRRTLQRIQNPLFPQEPKTIVTIDAPKTQNSLRVIPLPPFLSDLLRKSEQDIVDTEAFFLTGDTEKFMEPRTYQYYFNRLCVLLGLDGIHFHSLRHTFATRCIAVGFDIKTLSEILGHASVDITLNRYVHSSLETKKRQMAMLNLQL